MLVFGIDAHKRTHTVVVVDEVGRKLAQRTTDTTTTADHLALVRWADQFGSERRWAVEDCRHLSRRLERDLLAAGEIIVRVPPKLMANTRSSGRSYGKSDPIDALAVARAALREPDLPVARHDDHTRQVRLLVDHRDDLVAERTRQINRLRWHLHDLDPQLDPPERALTRPKHLAIVEANLADRDGLVARLARELLGSIRSLTERINDLERELAALVQHLAPALLARPGVGVLTAAKILGETAGIDRFHSSHAYARHTGCAPLPVWSANRTHYRLSRAGNRQLNSAIHRIAITQARYYPPAIEFITRRLTTGNTRRQAIRALKRRLSDAVYRDLHHDHTHNTALPHAA
jgi:transposase